MPEAGTTTRDTEDVGLAGQIDALLSGMGESAAALAADQTTEDMERALAEPSSRGAGDRSAPAAEEPLSPGEVEALAGQIDELVEEVGAATGRGGGRDVGSGARHESSARVVSGGGSLPEDLIDTADLGEEPPAEPRDLGDLDSQLAALAGAVEDAEPPEPAGSAAVLPGPPEPADSVDSETAAPPRAAAAAGQVKGAPIAPAVSAASPSGLGAAAWAAVCWVMGLSSRALSMAPKVARDTAGWIGLVTVFFACCMWAIILFFRSTPVPETYDVPSAVLEHGDPTPQPRPRPRAPAAHAPAAADHGKPADSHGASGGGGGGGHGAPAASSGGH